MANSALHTLDSLRELAAETHENSFAELILNSGNTINFGCRLLGFAGHWRSRQECSYLDLGKAGNILIQLEEVVGVGRDILRDNLVALGDKGHRVVNGQRRHSHLCIRPFLEKQKPLQIGIVHDQVTSLLNSDMGIVQVTACSTAGHQVAGANLDAEQRKALAHHIIAINLRADFLAGLVVKKVAADLSSRFFD